jgi:hypothetical protein
VNEQIRMFRSDKHILFVPSHLLYCCATGRDGGNAEARGDVLEGVES